MTNTLTPAVALHMLTTLSASRPLAEDRLISSQVAVLDDLTELGLAQVLDVRPDGVRVFTLTPAGIAAHIRANAAARDALGELLFEASVNRR